MINVEPITITNILEKGPQEIAAFLNTHVLAHKIPQYTANNPLTIQHDLVPLLGLYANNKAYTTELYNIVISALYTQKAHKRSKSQFYDDDVYTMLEAKKEILYRTTQALDRMYEATSRLMTGIGQPDSNMGRLP